MTAKNKPFFDGGSNIAMKVPPYLFAETVDFYKEVVRLPLLEEFPHSAVFEFGANQLWIDKVNNISQAEIWLEFKTDDVNSAAAYIDSYGVTRRDEIEPLPDNFNGFWICNPANVIHLVGRDD